jgi:coenzyme A diphosphatase NUDT7
VFRVQANKSAVVCFVSDPSLIEKLEPYPAEVDAIFTHPLRGVLEGKVDGEDAAGLSAKGGEWWPFEEEFHVRLSPWLC